MAEVSSAGSVNVGLDLKEMDIKVQPEGYVNIKVLPFKIRIPDVRIKFWFFPSIRLKGFDVMTEESAVQVQWDSAKMTAAIRGPSTTE